MSAADIVMIIILVALGFTAVCLAVLVTLAVFAEYFDDHRKD